MIERFTNDWDTNSMMSAITARLEHIFRAAFDLPPDADPSTVCQATQANWDSLAHVMLVSAIESEFGTTLDAADALEITSFEDARALIEARGV